jgi:hypothetical protein
MLKKLSYAIAIGSVALISAGITAVVMQGQGGKAPVIPGFDHPNPLVIQQPTRLKKHELFSEDHTADVLAIESVFSAYTFANDSHNGPLAASLFTEDAIIHFVWNNHGTLVPTFGINPKQTPDGPLGEGCVLTGPADIAAYFGFNRTANLAQLVGGEPGLQRGTQVLRQLRGAGEARERDDGVAAVNQLIDDLVRNTSKIVRSFRGGRPR